jgi:hypothetical protein
MPVTQSETEVLNSVKGTEWSRHELAELSLKLNGKPLNLTDHKLMWPLYDNDAMTTLFMTGRQVTKSTTLAGIIALSVFFIDCFKSLFVAPLKSHTYNFSTLYLGPFLGGSPILRKRLAINNVLLKKLSNGSRMHLGYCANGVDRIRGISVDEINWDEVQDIPLEIVFPVVQECMSASEYKRLRFCGTPKTKSNPIHNLWDKSSQGEPAIKCSRCVGWNIPDEEHIFDMLAEKGPICYHCNRLLRHEDILNPTWIHASPRRVDEKPGYHVPQIVIKRHLRKKDWGLLWEKYITYPKYMFANEVLGISFDTGGQLITLKELEDLCTFDPITLKSYRKGDYINVCAGVDWGVTGVRSFTVLVILGLTPYKRWKLLYFHKFLDTNPINQINKIVEELINWKVDMYGGDFGIGHTNNWLIRDKWCPKRVKKVAEYCYVKSKFMLSWSRNHSRFSLDKTMSLNQLLFNMKDGEIQFPKHPKIDQVFSDILAEREEIREGVYTINKVFVHNPDVPDDFLHAINFAQITSKRLAKMVLVRRGGDESLMQE